MSTPRMQRADLKAPARSAVWCRVWALTLNYCCQMGHDRSSPLERQLGEGEPNGSVFVFIDESYEPFVAAAGVVVESSDVRRFDSDIAATYGRLQRRYYLSGLPSFEEFRKKGFHATSDPMEVRMAFVALLAEALNFKSLVVYSNRTLRPDLSDKQRLIIVFDQLIRDVLRGYQTRPKITFYFESAQAMDLYLERLVARAVQSLGRGRPEIEVRFGTKRHPDLLAVPDYVLHIFNQWLSTQKDSDLAVNPRDHQSRSFKAILGSISMGRSLDDARVVRRTL